MYLAEVERCFNKGLLQKRGPSIDLARKSVRQADIFLKDAGKLIDSGMTRMGIIALYNAFFHAARTMLFKDGIKERSHFCMARYVESEYVLKNKLDKKFVLFLDSLRDMRHNTQYSLDFFEVDEDLDISYDICLEFIAEMEKLIE